MQSIEQISTWEVFRPEFFLLVDIRGFFFSDLGSGGTKKKINKKTLKMTSQLVIFRAFFFNISRKNSKTGKANQQYV